MESRLGPLALAPLPALLLTFVAGAQSTGTGVAVIVRGSTSPSLAPAPPVLFVDRDATGANDGRSWFDAYTDLQDALAVATAGDAIWIAAGTYTPDGPGGDRGATFVPPSGVALYGGFAGGETSLAQRDPQVHVVTLSGDLNGDDVYEPTLNLGPDNSWHVVTLDGTDASTRLDGLEVLAGSSFGAPVGQANGAGIVVRAGAATLVDCGVSYCVANEGGGLRVDDGAVLVSGCRFDENIASSSGFAGGAIALVGTSVVTIEDTSFTGNVADGVATGIAGGALAADGGTTVSIRRCAFVRNRAANRLNGYIDLARGGAIYNDHALMTIEASTFDSNSSNLGGALYAWDSAATTVLNCVFDGNSVTPYVSTAGIEIGGDGGTIYAGTALTLVGSLVHGGDADNVGGVYAGAGYVSSCIFWGNTDKKGDIGISQVKADEVRYSCVENMLVGEPGEDPPDPEKFPGCTAADPAFVDAATGDFHLVAGSPVVDAAENPAWPVASVVDRDGLPRFVDDPSTVDTGIGPGPVADMGPYEYAPLALSDGGSGHDGAGNGARLHRRAGSLVLTGAPAHAAVVLLAEDVPGVDGRCSGSEVVLLNDWTDARGTWVAVSPEAVFEGWRLQAWVLDPVTGQLTAYASAATRPPR